MQVFRGLLFLLLMVSAVSMALYLATGKLHYKRWSFVVLKWSVIAGLAFFAVLGVSRFLGI